MIDSEFVSRVEYVEPKLTCGVWWAREVVPLTSIRFSWRSTLSELELNTHENLRSPEGLAMTSQVTRVRSLLATP